jgi:hypothetical protein
MNTVNIKKTTSLRLSSELYNHIERIAKKQNRSVNNYIETILFKATGYNEPNETTKTAMAEIDDKNNSLKHYSDLETLFEDLEK